MTRSMTPDESRDFCAEFARLTAERLRRDGHGPLEIGMGLLMHACLQIAENAGLDEMQGVELFEGAVKASHGYVQRRNAESN